MLRTTALDDAGEWFCEIESYPPFIQNRGFGLQVHGEMFLNVLSNKNSNDYMEINETINLDKGSSGIVLVIVAIVLTSFGGLVLLSIFLHKRKIIPRAEPRSLPPGSKYKNEDTNNTPKVYDNKWIPTPRSSIEENSSATNMAYINS